ncbi:protein kinase domain containing protein [Stylonychia lemnae]|uniref:Protein kinase domain containing protein n=1 Tax=Stylonychia lemnae TaxID=5949 RepID=A0A078ANY3_STYLE|nr:protein kinase domain containing protein [Stylonychia lemnae]|eukprot:CDW83859.1 protein kinase domain containing protein [Stylonychia lemnae]
MEEHFTKLDFKNEELATRQRSEPIFDIQKQFKTIGEYTIDFSQFLGKGKYGEVYNAHKSKEYKDDKRYACKIIKANLVEEQQNILNEKLQQGNNFDEQEFVKNYLSKQIQQEIDSLMLVKSHYTIQLIKAYKAKSGHYLITELCNGGSLQNLLKLRGRFQEEQARMIFKQIINGIFDMHSMDIIHRDLKLANILLNFPENNIKTLSKQQKQEFLRDFDMEKVKLEVKISDFGFSKTITVQTKKKKHTICGTPAYMAPDLQIGNNRQYSNKIDIWALGIIFYELLVGVNPFQGNNSNGFKKKLKQGVFIIPDDVQISAKAISLISRCLQYEEDQRISIKEFIKDEYFDNQYQLSRDFDFMQYLPKQL